MTDGLRRAEAELRAFIASGFSLSRGAEGVFDHLIFTQVAGSVGFGPRDIVALQRRARRGVQKLQSGELWELPTRLRYKLSWDANRLSALERRAPGPSASMSAWRPSWAWSEVGFANSIVAHSTFPSDARVFVATRASSKPGASTIATGSAQRATPTPRRPAKNATSDTRRACEENGQQEARSCATAAPS